MICGPDSDVSTQWLLLNYYFLSCWSCFCFRNNTELWWHVKCRRNNLISCWTPISMADKVSTHICSLNVIHDCYLNSSISCLRIFNTIYEMYCISHACEINYNIISCSYISCVVIALEDRVIDRCNCLFNSRHSSSLWTLCKIVTIQILNADITVIRHRCYL